MAETGIYSYCLQEEIIHTIYAGLKMRGYYVKKRGKGRSGTV